MDERYKTKFEKMMDEVAPIIEKYGYTNLGFVEMLQPSEQECLRFVKEEVHEILDIISQIVDEEVWDNIFRKDEE